MRYRNRFQFSLPVLTVFFLLAALFAVLLLMLTPETPALRGPLLLVSFSVVFLGGLLCILFLLRWILHPYRQLVGEAERTSIAPHRSKSKGEAEFVLETFESVVAQLQSQQKELERLRAQASERADSAERFNERIVASVPSGLIAFDDGGRAMVINATGRDLLGVDGKDLGEPAGTLLRNARHLAAMVERCLTTGKLYRREEIEAVDAEGRTRRLGATIAPIDLSPERGARGALCLISDITEVTQLREQVALKRNLESLGEMSAGLAHEFKNAIATLHGYAQLLQNLELDERGRTAASAMLNEVRNLSEMITAFLNFARPQPLELDDVPVDQLIKECATELGSLFDERRVELVLNLSEQTSVNDDVLVIRADERMLRQALLNLLRNAAEAITEDKEERRVFIRSHHDEDRGRKQWAVVVVSDTGQGIPAPDLQRIFIPFFTTKAKGHGVGLALAHRVISDHGGTLTADNASEGGAIFTLRLPM